MMLVPVHWARGRHITCARMCQVWLSKFYHVSCPSIFHPSSSPAAMDERLFDIEAKYPILLSSS